MSMLKVKMSEIGDSLVPEGTYHMRVHKSEFVEVPKNPTSSPYIKTCIVITGPDGPFVGRIVFANYPISGGGSNRLKELLKMTFHSDDCELTDASELIGLEFNALVMIESGTNGYADRNVIKRHVELF